MRPIRGVSAAALATRVNDASDDADALTRARAAQKSPGVAQVRQSFQVIFLLYGLVVPLVTGLFFLIITFQKSAALTLLRAIGARSGLLVRSLIVQVVLVVGGGLAVGVALYAPLSQLRLGDIALRFDVVRGRVLGRAAARARRAERDRGRPAGPGDRSDRGHGRRGRAMRLALRELRRRPGRFGVAAAILTLIAVLLMFLGGLLDGLTAGNTGAVRARTCSAIWKRGIRRCARP